MLAEKSGVKRHAFLDFINKSVMGSMFTRYKTPALVNLDFTPTFTPCCCARTSNSGSLPGASGDADAADGADARDHAEPYRVGIQDQDFATLLVQQARNSGST